MSALIIKINAALADLLVTYGLPRQTAGIITDILAAALIIFLAVCAYKIVHIGIVRSLHRLVAYTKTQWESALRESRLLTRLAHIAPLLVLKIVGFAIFVNSPFAHEFIAGVVRLYLIVLLVGIAYSLLDFFQLLTCRTQWVVHVPIKGIIQATKLILFLIAAILILSVFLGQTPAYLLSGIGALAAVFMLIFKDALLGFTAGIMLSANQLVRIGDWIEMPSAGADGDVLDVTLTTVKVQNWDKTIVSIPAYSLISGSFKNWRGMSESGGRRIKRAINIDMQTVRFADENMLNRWRRIGLLRPYLDEKLREVTETNSHLADDISVLGNGRRLTNLGTFRAYCEAYLRQHAKIHKNMTLMVRQLRPTETGLPLELYSFTNDTNWVKYEGIQADIFDHLLAIIGEFDLAVYQRPSSTDNRAWISALTASK